MDHIVSYLEKIEDLPMKDLEGISALRRAIREPIPSRGVAFDKILKLIFTDFLPKGIQVPSPGYLAYIPVGSIFPSVLGEFISYAINRWPGLYQYAPGFVEIENTVIRSRICR